MGYAGPPSQQAAEVQTKYIIVDMYAKAVQGMKPETSVKWAHDAAREGVRLTGRLVAGNRPRCHGESGLWLVSTGVDSLKLSSAGAVAASTGGLAGILASGRAPAYAQASAVHWLRWADLRASLR